MTVSNLGGGVMAEPDRREPTRADRSSGSTELTVDAAGRSGTRTVIRVAGRLDARFAPTLARELADAARSSRRGPRRVALDLSGVTYIDILGLQVLLDAQDRLTAESGELELLSPTAAVIRLLHEAHLHEAHLQEAHLQSTCASTGTDRTVPGSRPEPLTPPPS
ncbi:MAG TPA: STAS domain-containing protein [Nakamurella sp.]